MKMETVAFRSLVRWRTKGGGCITFLQPQRSYFFAHVHVSDDFGAADGAYRTVRRARYLATLLDTTFKVTIFKFRFTIPIAAIYGFTTYLMNWWLISRGIKKKMQGRASSRSPAGDGRHHPYGAYFP